MRYKVNPTTERVRIEHDREANKFAMALLMPEKLVRAEVKKMGGIDLSSDNSIKRLAQVFQVPVALMAMRLEQLTKEPTQ